MKSSRGDLQAKNAEAGCCLRVRALFIYGADEQKSVGQGRVVICKPIVRSLVLPMLDFPLQANRRQVEAMLLELSEIREGRARVVSLRCV